MVVDTSLWWRATVHTEIIEYPMRTEREMTQICGAKTRAGTPCASIVVMPNGRCRMHGGATPKKNIAVTTHGIYRNSFTSEERELAVKMRLGSVDEDLQLARIRVRRALAAEALANNELEIVETVRREGGGENVASYEEVARVRDYAGLIDKMLARVESLEKTRLLLRTELGIDADDMDADALTSGTADEKTPTNPVR